MNFVFTNQTKIPKWNHYKEPLKQVFLKVVAYFELDENTQVSCVLINQDTMHQYNAEFRKKDRPTDVLTFVDDQQEHYLGDVLINVDAVMAQAYEYEHTLKREICFLFAHGLLHTLGYDHHTPKEEQAMIAVQKEILHDVSKRRYRSSNPKI
jgi:probable rRNA maturation factor